MCFSEDTYSNSTVTNKELGTVTDMSGFLYIYFLCEEDTT